MKFSITQRRTALKKALSLFLLALFTGLTALSAGAGDTPALRFDMDWYWDGAGARMFTAYISIDLNRPITGVKLHIASEGPGAAGGEDGFFRGQARNGDSEDSPTIHGQRNEALWSAPDMIFEIPSTFTNVTLQADGNYESNSETDIKGQISIYVEYADAPGQWMPVTGDDAKQAQPEIHMFPKRENVSADVPLPEDAAAAYLQILREYQSLLQEQLPWWVGDSWENGVAFMDITGDGIPEMFCAMPSEALDASDTFYGVLAIWSYHNGAAHLLLFDEISYPMEGNATFVFLSPDQKRLYVCGSEYFWCYEVKAGVSLSLLYVFQGGWHPEEDWAGKYCDSQNGNAEEWVSISKEEFEKLCDDVWADIGTLLFGSLEKAPAAAAGLSKMVMSCEQAIYALTNGLPSAVNPQPKAEAAPPAGTVNNTSPAIPDSIPSESGNIPSSQTLTPDASAAVPPETAQDAPPQESSVRAYSEARPQLIATASSTYTLKYNTEYAVSADMVIDGNLKTAWNEGANGTGIGEWIELRPADGGNYQYTGFSIANGFQFHDYHKGDRYPKNNRVKELSVFLDDVLLGTYVVEDLSDGYSTFYFDETVTGCALRFVIDGVYKGKTFSDTCISELVPF